MFSSKKDVQKGFTLMELLVVVLILTVLVAIALPAYRKSVLKAHATESLNLLRAVRSKQVLNYSKTKQFFTSFENMPGGKLTQKEESYSEDSQNILTIGNYDVELSLDKQCALSHYKPNGETKFSLSISYLREGFGCTGDICNQLPDIIGDAEEVCVNPYYGTVQTDNYDFSCPDTNFDPTSCSFPKVLSLDGCSCVCVNGIESSCSAIQTFNATDCSCDCDESKVPVPENSENFSFNNATCQYECDLSIETCVAQEKIFNQEACACECNLDPLTKTCSCLDGRVNIGGKCGYCNGQYHTYDGVAYCCSGDTPHWNGTDCVACPEGSTWQTDKCVCDSPYVEKKIGGILVECECPAGTFTGAGAGNIIGDSKCKCPYNTSAENTGGLYNPNSPCRCPAGMTWGRGAYNQYYCMCDDGETELGSSSGYTIGKACCPAGTVGSRIIRNGQTLYSKTNGYGGEQVPGMDCFCPDSNYWDDKNKTCTPCPAGSRLDYYGPSTSIEVCKCPAGTSTKLTGNDVSGGPCKCPANMSWVEQDYWAYASSGYLGGYCSCNEGNTEFSTTPGTTSGSWGSNYFGIACCPANTAGYQFATFTKTEGYSGGRVYALGSYSQYCWCRDNMFWDAKGKKCKSCPAGTGFGDGWRGGENAGTDECKCPAYTSTANTGGAISTTSKCKCPSGMNWVSNKDGVDGGYCSCIKGYTQFVAEYSYKGSVFRDAKFSMGASCCPTGTAGYEFNTKNKTKGYEGGQVTGLNCFCPDGKFWSDEDKKCISCPAGTSTSYSGEQINSDSCKCPANTSVKNEGGAVSDSACRCPAKMEWVSNKDGVDGGYCACKESYTEFSAADKHHNIGVACCPTKTAGYVFGTSTLESGYNGEQISGRQCFCPNNSGKKSEDFNGSQIEKSSCYCKTGLLWKDGACQCPEGTSTTNKGTAVEDSACRCPADTIWTSDGCKTCEELYGTGFNYTEGKGMKYPNCCDPSYAPNADEETGCSLCPKGSYYSNNCSGCVCDNGYGLYEQTKGCKEHQCPDYQALNRSDCSCACRIGSDLDSSIILEPNDKLGCCYCPKKVGVTDDPSFTSDGCYTGWKKFFDPKKMEY